MDIQKLMEHAVQLLQSARYTSSRIYTYRWLWTKGIIPFMKAKGLSDYNEDVGNAFMLTCHDGSDLSYHHRDLVKSVDVLTNAMLRNTIGGRMSYKTPYRIGGEIGNAVEKFLLSLEDLRRSYKTIQSYRKRLSNFVEYLTETDIKHICDITEDTIIGYISNRKYRQVEYIRSAKLFMQFLYKSNLKNKDLSYAMRSLGKKFKHVRTSSFYSPDEIVKLENSISRSCNVGKRNYAMIMLCSRLGLRVSDVANLEFGNLDWEASTINIIQYKTGHPLTLPLLPEVGNAIIDYLQYGRKKTSCHKIFLSLRPPYEAMTASSVHNAIAAAFVESGIKIDDRHHGGHALRFSLAQRMLNKSTPIPIISETLGHQEVDMTRTYIRIDLHHIRHCVLDVSTISDDFYTQKGGCFYE